MKDLEEAFNMKDLEEAERITKEIDQIYKATEKQTKNETLIEEYYKKLPKDWSVRDLENELIQKRVCLISLYKQARQIECLTKALEKRIQEQKAR